MTQKDRPKLPLLVLAAGGILLGAAALQSVLITVPGSGSSNPHAISVDTKPAVAEPKPWDEPSKSPAVVTPAEPADPSPTGAVPDAPQSADHAVDPAAPPSPAKVESTGAETATESAKPAADQPKIETPPAELKPAPKPEPSQIAKAEPKTVAPPVPSEIVAAEPKPAPPPEPAAVADAPEESLEAVAKAPAVPDAKPIEEAKVETLPDEPSPAAQPEPAEAAASTTTEAEAEAEKAAEAPRTKVTEAAAEARSPEPQPAPVAKASRREEKPAPKPMPAGKPRETAAAKAQGGLFGKPMTLGFGRKSVPAAGKVSSGRYAANVRAAIGRHRPRAGGGGSATVAFSIGPGGGLQGVRVVRSSGRQAADQAAIATVRAAAPFPPPPAGINSTFSIQIYFR